MAHPCCGFSLKNGSIILATLDIIGSIFGILTAAVTLIYVTGYEDRNVGKTLEVEEYKNQPMVVHHGIGKLMEHSAGFVISTLLFVILMCLIELVLAVLLFRGAVQRNVVYCGAWWKIKCVLFFFSTAMVSFALITSDDRLDFALGSLFGFFYQFYGLWVVKAFIIELHLPLSCQQKQKEIEKL